MKFRNTGSYSNAERSGRPRKTTPRDDHVIQRAAARSPMSSASKSRAVGLLLANGVDVSWRTVSRRLVNDFGLKSRKPAKKTRLTPTMKAKCLAFVKKHVNWTIQQGHHVLFSDKLTVQQFTTRKRYIR